LDITYLLLLQNFRNGAGAFLTMPMFVATAFAESFTLLTIAAIIYWCCDKRLGKLILMNFSFSYAVATMLKNSFCIYRPWMRDSAVLPAGNAIETATGYSFPSRHTARIASFSMPIIAKKHEKNKVLCAFLIVAIFVVAFSRNFLGVHTPQDVICAALLSLAVTCVTLKIDSWLEENPNRDTQFFLIASAFFLIATAIFVLKPYPVDYHGGKIIYSPLKPKYESFGIAGNTLGFLVGWYIERKFINFEVPKSALRKIFAGVLGLLLFFLLHFCMTGIKPYLYSGHWSFLKGFYPYLFILAVWPLAIKLFFNKEY